MWVAVYDGFSRMAVPLFIIVSAFLLAPMKAGLTSWQFYRQRCIRSVVGDHARVLREYINVLTRSLIGNCRCTAIGFIDIRRKWSNVPLGFYLMPALILITGVMILAYPFGAAANTFVIFGVASIFYGACELINWYKFRKRIENTGL